MYVMILEVVLVAILVFVVGPILFVRFGLPNFYFLLVLADSNTLHSYFGAFSYCVSVVTLHKTHTISHQTLDKSRGLSSINSHS